MRPGVNTKLIESQVPNDAVLMDLIFSDSGGMNSGFCDNNRGFDYHIPISGGTGTLQPLKIVHLSVEMAPIAKVCAILLL